MLDVGLFVDLLGAHSGDARLIDLYGWSALWAAPSALTNAPTVTQAKFVHMRAPGAVQSTCIGNTIILIQGSQIS